MGSENENEQLVTAGGVGLARDSGSAQPSLLGRSLTSGAK